jgi:hypothetical protein
VTTKDFNGAVKTSAKLTFKVEAKLAAPVGSPLTASGLATLKIRE